ncbi:hypothetical protein DCAR_0728815 [Daucus carota subsp. sativus]|uniref:Uncharacterized protein n=1 Tax=Daucus carota subsp. sativus TaxID=79200 RepID=A0A164TV28_DAUCS|nr:PREDICTED: putative disease resistance protein RGA4 [Daucus carota subsp. sativus]WOH09358.1 hypothetical protein DCAR_0728815 [Daucus carota subsp. sativus]
MAEAILIDVASGLISRLVSLAADEVIRAWNVHEDLEELCGKLEFINDLLLDASAKKLTMTTVQRFFNKLEDVAHVANVFMNELEYEVTRQKVENHQRKRDFFVPSKNTMLHRFKMAHKIKSILDSFKEILKWGNDLGLQPVAYLNTTVQPSGSNNTSPFQDKALIVGRDKDISYLVQMVCKNHQENLRLIAVIGMGGQGKTTLARMVFNSDIVVNMFPNKIWVTVSHDFDLMNILNQMVESLTSKPSMFRNAQGVINVLQKKLKGKKFLLVLDNVWNEKPENWDELMNSLLGFGGAKGSSILITTRNQKVIDAMRCPISYRLDNLSEQDSWELFKKSAFSQGGVVETKAFAALGRHMVERCGGLPLAINSLASVLRTKKSEQEWLQIQDSETWKSERILPALRFSYNNLPSTSLKRCFAYCSIVPKTSKIYKDDIVQIWMALGFLLPPKGSALLMEDIGNEYLNILLWNSLLQEGDRDKLGDITYYKMHDLVHDLALDVSKHNSATMNDSGVLSHNSKATYVRLDEGYSGTKPANMRRNFEGVQMLYVGARILGNVLPYLKHLTALVVNNDEVTYLLPSSLHKMKYLKHLDISCFHGKLPNHITEFYNLQTLRVGNLEELPKKFCNLINLRHLVITDKNGDPPSCMFTGIEKLTCLQTLPHFVVSRDQNCLLGKLGGLNNLRGKLSLYGLSDVMNREEASAARLCRKSYIHRLLLEWRSIKDDQEDRKYNDEDVMEGLKPHVNLKKLKIVNFEGKKFASWIIMMRNLVEITVIDSERCEEFPPLGHLPKLRKIKISSMENVKVIGSDIWGGVGSSGTEFSESGAPETVTTMYPSLTELILQDLPKLEEWLEPVVSSGSEDQRALLVFPKIEILVILNCPNLRRIPRNCFTFLKELVISDLDSSNMILESVSRTVSSLRYLRLVRISDGKEESSSPPPPNLDSISNKLLTNNSLSLRSLDIHQCEALTCLTLGVALQQLEVCYCPQLATISVAKDSVGLKYLRIASCPSLSEWVFVQSMSSTLVQLVLGPFLAELEEFPWPFSSAAAAVIPFPNLIELNLYGWRNVKSILPSGKIGDRLSSTFPALTELIIQDFKGVKALPESLAKLPCLRDLRIFSCGNLRSLPTFDESSSLQYLEISGCPVLQERCRKEGGSEWFKIQHIPHIEW